MLIYLALGGGELLDLLGEKGVGGSTPFIFSKGSRGKMKEVNPYNVHYQRKAGYEAEKSTKSGDPEPVSP